MALLELAMVADFTLTYQHRFLGFNYNKMKWFTNYRLEM
jgi:hypothetical protein